MKYILPSISLHQHDGGFLFIIITIIITIIIIIIGNMNVSRNSCSHIEPSSA